MKVNRWTCPHDWLHAKVEQKRQELAVLAPEAENQVEWLIGAITALLIWADPDDIQEAFGPEMDADGYYG